MENISYLYGLFLSSAGISTDSRSIVPGSLFFALKGENFDGNKFASKALESGAAYAIVDDPEVQQGKNHILVKDVLYTLQQLAMYHRKQFNIPVFALTGSNGKTTTKELITKVLSVKYNVLSTTGNLNNHIGVPLTILKIDNTIQAAVIEMGASAPGEIMTLAKIAQPTAGLVTNVGKAHLLGFGSFEGVRKTKGELYDYIAQTGGTALYNTDNPITKEMAASRGNLAAIPYGASISGSRILETTPQEPYLRVLMGTGETLNTKIIGSYNIDNILAALAVGELYKCDRLLSIKAIESYIPSNNRSQLVKGENNNLVVDAYNANPTSMKAALENFESMKTSAKGVVLGDMLELGKDSAKEHLEILRMLENMNMDHIFLVGKEFAQAAQGYSYYQKRALITENSLQLKDYLDNHKTKGVTYLIKGSRGIRLERIIESLS